VSDHREQAGDDLPRVGFVVIGRNEGARLEQCLRSALAHSYRIVYADSASTDGSADRARALGIATVVLDNSMPTTAARGRNAGFEALLERFPECEFVQFIDGDCVLASGWVRKAAEFLQSHELAAIACGRRFEAHPEASPYNRLCDEEWNTPVGRVESAGGDSMVRVSAFKQVGGFRPELKAGEEPEMTARMRAAGWEIWRLDAPMSEHDAKILRFGQWWRRMLRGGFGYAHVWSTSGNLPQRIFAIQLRSALIWTIGIPLLVCLATLLLQSVAVLLALPLLYLLQIVRFASRRRLLSWRSWQAATLIVLAKLPETIGALRYFLGQGPERIGEYKARPA
jgi:glycosyltransferase involved in cell wall biosynthesis